MTTKTGTARLGEGPAVEVKIGNASEALKAIQAAVAKRAYEAFQRRGSRPGSDQEDWRVAEGEVLQPLCCGILESRHNAEVSVHCSELGVKDIEEIEVCVEPHRLILVGKKRSRSGAREEAVVYRVLPSAAELDPSVVKAKLKQRGSLLEIELHKLGSSSLIESLAA